MDSGLHRLFEELIRDRDHEMHGGFRGFGSPTTSRGRGPPRVCLDFGHSLVKHGPERVPTADALRSKSSLGLYFADARCPHCPRFTTKLARFYSQYKALDPAFEIVFVSVDRNREAALQHFSSGHGEWLMVPFSEDVQSRLSRGFGVSAVPTLVICGADGTMIWRDAVSVVGDLTPQEIYREGTFRPLTVGMQLESRRDGQALGRVVAVDEDGDPITEMGGGQQRSLHRQNVRPVGGAGGGGGASPTRPQFGNFAVGDYVRVRPGVGTPKYQWGSVAPGDIGVVAHKSFGSQDILVDFPQQAGWRALAGEMEAVQLQVGMDVKLSYQGLKDMRMLAFLPRGRTARVVGFDGDGDPHVDSAGDRKYVSRNFIVPVGVLAFALGSHVGAFGLSGAVELNGRSGKVEKLADGRVHVDFGSGVVKALKPDNLAQSFPPGCVVEIRGLASAAALNGAAAKVVRFEGGRYVVEVLGRSEVKSVKAENLLIKHPTTRCDGCGAGAFAGVRYKCASCPDYDLCPACHDRRHALHPGHAFGAIPAPLSAVQIQQVLWQARQSAAGGASCPKPATPTSPAKPTPPQTPSAAASTTAPPTPSAVGSTPSAAASTTAPPTPSAPGSTAEFSFAPEPRPEATSANQGPAANANANANAPAGGGEDADREALRAWLGEKMKVSPKMMEEALQKCDENHIYTVAHAEMMQEEGLLQDMLPEQSLEDWLAFVANVDARSLQWAVDVCKANKVFTVDDIRALSRAQLQDIFGKSVVRVQVAKAVGQKDSGAEPGTSGGSTTYVTSSGGTTQCPGEGRKYRRVRDLGEGSYGVTYLAEKDGKEYCVKRSKGKSQREAEEMVREAMRMSQVKHERLVCIQDIFLEADPKGIRLNIVLEYCSGGDLLSRLRRPPKPTGEEASHFVACVAEGLAYMHEQKPPMVHRDVKPANILLCPGAPGGLQNAKLGDLGLARSLSDTGSTQIIAGSRFYMSPDAFEGASGASDVWALGRVAAELAAGEPAKQMLAAQSQVDELLAGIPKGDMSESFRATMRDMLQMEAGARPTASDVARHLSGSGDDLSSFAASTQDIGAILKGLAWMQPSGVAGMNWEQEGNGVKRCTFSPSCCTDPEATAQRHMLDLINLTPSNKSFTERYWKQIQSTVLCKSTVRATGFIATCMKLSNRYSKMANFSLEREMGEPGTEKGRWRRRVLQHFEQRYPSLCTEASMSNVRIRTAFHATRGMETALDILNGGFASLKKTDPGYIGDGIYVTLDPEYALKEYGKEADVPLIVCAVVCGNPYPVIENHVLQPNDNFLGKALVAKADAHIAVMARDPAANRGSAEPLPCPLEKWGELELLTEVALPEAQVLPLGVLLVRAR